MPGVLEYVPGLHGVHVAEPGNESYEPAGQITVLVALEFATIVPAGAIKHVAYPVPSANQPTGQALH